MRWISNLASGASTVTLCLCLFPTSTLQAQTTDQSVSDGQSAPPWPLLRSAQNLDPLPNTDPLPEDQIDFADLILEGAESFLNQKIADSRKNRNPTTEELIRCLGLAADKRHPDPKIEYYGPKRQPVWSDDLHTISSIRWPAIRHVYGYGMLFEPKGKERSQKTTYIWLNDPESEIPLLRLQNLARAGCRVLAITLLSRTENQFTLSHREYIHRSAYELGRTLIGYELHMLGSAIDALYKKNHTLVVGGNGEGGRLALYIGALRPEHLDGVEVQGYFGPRENVWNEPADRTLFGQLVHLGDAEIASLIPPQKLFVAHHNYPKYIYRSNDAGEPEIATQYTKKKGKPGKLSIPSLQEFESERKRIPNYRDLPNWSPQTIFDLLVKEEVVVEQNATENDIESTPHGRIESVLAEQQQRLLVSLDAHNQWALIDSRRLRAEFMSGLVTNKGLDAYKQSTEKYRKTFREEVVGHFSDPLLDAKPKSRAYQTGEEVRSYEVVLETFPGLIAYGILTIPEDLPLDGSKKLPAVVCQHGLEGRPQHVIGKEKHKAYKAFATRLAQRGYVTFAPQNLYIKFDRFRGLQFKAAALGKTIFSLMVPQHQQITNWLAEQPFIDGEKIGFYGLSYGGKSAMRIPALVDRYALSICSADFNEWVWKNAATDAKSLRYSYANKGEYEIFEWNLGGTFNYAEMAMLICPRPFMVERGHFDGVAPDETVGYEYAKVRHLYAGLLGIPERTRIEWFPGPHTINGVGAYQFLDRWLKQKN